MDTANETLGERLARLRNAKGWTQAQLAQRDEAQLQRIKQIVAAHGAELSVRRRQLTVRLNYGLIDDSKWQKEVGMFLASVVQPYAGAIAVFSKNYWAALQEIDLTSLMQNDARIGFSEDISPIEYEQLVAQILTEHGWDTRLTATTGDQGVDVIADKRNIKAVIQCKLYSKPVGNAAVQEAIAGKAFEQAHIAVVVTNAGFTKSARQLATASGVLLLHHDQLGELDTLAK